MNIRQSVKLSYLINTMIALKKKMFIYNVENLLKLALTCGEKCQ